MLNSNVSEEETADKNSIDQTPKHNVFWCLFYAVFVSSGG